MAADFTQLRDGLGEKWRMQGVAFKPYPCGTMAQPFIDCALALRSAGIAAQQIREIRCEVGEGTVHRLWEPLAQKRRPSSAYGAKFSVPFAIAVAIVDGMAGLQQFTDARVQDREVLCLAEKIRYDVNPDDEYPVNYTGHLDVSLDDGERLTFRQPHLRGGRREPLTTEELERKFAANARFGGWDAQHSDAVRAQLDRIIDNDRALDLTALRC